MGPCMSSRRFSEPCERAATAHATAANAGNPRDLNTGMPPDWRERIRPRPLSLRAINRIALAVFASLVLACVGLAFLLYSLRAPPIWAVPIEPDSTLGRIFPDGLVPVRGRTADDAVRIARQRGYPVRFGEPVCRWPGPHALPSAKPGTATITTLLPQAGVREER